MVQEQHYIKLWAVTEGPNETEGIILDKYSYYLVVKISGPVTEENDSFEEDQKTFREQPIFFETEEEALLVKQEIEDSLEPLMWEVDVPEDYLEEEYYEGPYDS